MHIRLMQIMSIILPIFEKSYVRFNSGILIQALILRYMTYSFASTIESIL